MWTQRMTVLRLAAIAALTGFAATAVGQTNPNSNAAVESECKSQFATAPANDSCTVGFWRGFGWYSSPGVSAPVCKLQTVECTKDDGSTNAFDIGWIMQTDVPGLQNVDGEITNYTSWPWP